MPSDVAYPFATPSYGTVGSCVAQGLFYSIGSYATHLLAVLLNVYYLCKLKHGMDDTLFRRRIEIISYIVLLLTMVLSSIASWKGKSINPSFMEPICAFYPYPDGCTADENDCQSRINSKSMHFIWANIMFIAFLSLMLTTALIITSFRKEEKRLRTELCNSTNSNGFGDHSLLAERIIQAKLSRKVVTKQAIMYFVALALPSLSFFLYYSKIGKYSAVFSMIKMIFHPLQGFFNAGIFFYYKIRLLRKREVYGLTAVCAFVRLMKYPQDAPDDVIIGNIDFVLMVQSINIGKVDQESAVHNEFDRDSEIFGDDSSSRMDHPQFLGALAMSRDNSSKSNMSKKDHLGDIALVQVDFQKFPISRQESLSTAGRFDEHSIIIDDLGSNTFYGAQDGLSDSPAKSISSVCQSNAHLPAEEAGATISQSTFTSEQKT